PSCHLSPRPMDGLRAVLGCAVLSDHLMESPVPDLVVYLQAPVEVLMQRVHKRSRKGERDMDPGYLQKLLDLYNGYFSSYKDSPLLIINTAHINPLASEEDFKLLVEKICTIKAGRHFFNPVPSLF
ncbi:MAG: deoxynucleoside kinase, partial [Gammaproteobacteria bacterium]